MNKDLFFANKLKELRLKHQLTQKELGEKLGLSDSTITQYEKGAQEPKRATIVKISQIFGISIDYFFPKNETLSTNLKTNYPNTFTTSEINLARQYVKELQSGGLLHFGGILPVEKMTDESVIEYANNMKSTLEAVAETTANQTKRKLDLSIFNEEDPEQ